MEDEESCFASLALGSTGVSRGWFTLGALRRLAFFMSDYASLGSRRSDEIRSSRESQVSMKLDELRSRGSDGEASMLGMLLVGAPTVAVIRARADRSACG